jgi:MFS transporter, OFA family, oxalate/formate antiporter
MFQKISLVSAAVAAGMVGIVSIGNAVGRIFWAWVFDAVTRRWTFAVMFLLQFGLFWILPAASHFTMLTILSFVILTCYGAEPCPLLPPITLARKMSAPSTASC